MIHLKGKKLLILGGIALSREIIAYAKKMGIYVIVTDYLENSPAKKVADKSFLVSTTEVDAVVNLIHQENIDGVLTGFIDLLLPYYQQICLKAGVPCYATKQQFDILTNKLKFKQLCQKFNIPVVEDYPLKYPLVNEELNQLKYPILIKPSDNSGGRGIFICKDEKDLKNNFEKCLGFSPSKQILAERYMNVKEATIFYVVQDGNIILTAMADRHVNHFQDGIIPLPVAYTLPSIYLGEYQKNLHPRVVDMFQSIGLESGMLFIQTFVENGQCVIYEVGYRLTGSLEYKIIEHASGYNPLKMMINHAISGEMSSEDISSQANPNFDKYYCNITLLVEPGRIGRILGVEQTLAIKGVIDVFLSYSEGDEIPQTALGTLAQVVARVFAFANTPLELASIMNEVHNTFSVISSAGNNMLLPTFDTNELLN
jgi:biotin carboxylase